MPSLAFRFFATFTAETASLYAQHLCVSLSVCPVENTATQLSTARPLAHLNSNARRKYPSSGCWCIGRVQTLRALGPALEEYGWVAATSARCYCFSLLLLIMVMMIIAAVHILFVQPRVS